MMRKAVVLTSTTVSASQYRRKMNRRCVSLVNQTNHRRWEIRGACTARACAFAWSSSAVVAEREADVSDVVVVVEDPLGLYRLNVPLLRNRSLITLLLSLHRCNYGYRRKGIQRL
jgi:hypothetical protein